MSHGLLWHRNDYRLEDHRPLTALCVAHTLMPLVILPNSMREDSSLASSARREAVSALHQRYHALGSRLSVFFGEPVEVLSDLVKRFNVDIVAHHASHDARGQKEETECSKALSTLGCSMMSYVGDLLVDDVSSVVEETSPDPSFSQFQAVYSRHIPENIKLLPAPKSLPRLPDGLDEVRADDWLNQPVDTERATGERRAHDRLSQYFWRSELPSQYLSKRDDLRDRKETSRLSDFLALGCLSPRQVFYQLKEFERRRVSNRSTKKLKQELYWRDFLRITARLVGDDFFKLSGSRAPTRSWVEDPALAERWASGQTGWPIIDAAMRQLNSTGFMTQESRLNVSSFLVNDLGIDWRYGAEHFSKTLVDHDVCSNYGNWQVVAGVAHEPMKHRRGIKQQSLRLDRATGFTKRWVPELKPLPPPTVHEMNGRHCGHETKAFGVTLGETYPEPIGRIR